jgi:uncharacterized glyoxalase superfamily protein PhnB
MQPKLDMIGLTVKDIKASMDFYRLLGLDFPADQAGESHVEAVSGGMRVALDSVAMAKDIDPAWTEPVGQSMTMAFLCESASEVDALYRKIVAAGFKGYKEPWDAFWGQRYAVVKDPDGNKIDLFARL